jgi:dihydropteroate synthase
LRLQCGQRQLDLSEPRIMGILNVTPDSFSDGGLFVRPEQALRHVEQMIADGAAIIDVGGESTRPGAEPVATAEELQRVIPVIEAIAREFDVAISVDTSSAAVMRESAAAGAHIINDVRSLRREGALAAAVASRLPVCLMHMVGEPTNMQNNPHYDDVVSDVADFLQQRADECEQAGMSKDRILIDPGFGFAKTYEHNYQLLNQLEKITALGYPLLTGLSRKRMIAAAIGGHSSPEDRDVGSAAAALLCVLKGARIIRVHNVKATADAVSVLQATLGEGNE